MGQPYFNTSGATVKSLNTVPQQFYTFTPFEIPNLLLSGLMIDILGISTSANNNAELTIADNSLTPNILFKKNIFAPLAAPFYIPNLISLEGMNLAGYAGYFIYLSTTANFSFVNAYISCQGYGFCT